MSTELMLKQVLIEQNHTKKAIRNIVRNEILNWYDASDANNPMEKAIELIEEWLWKADHGYESKNIRIKELRALEDFSVEEVVIDILTAILIVPHNQTIQNVAAYACSSFDMGDVFTNIKCAAEMIAVACYSDMYDLIAPRNSETGSLQVASKLSLPDAVLDDIAYRQYLPPMLVKPNKVTNNNDAGYMVVREHVVLKKHNSDNKENLCLEALNAANNTALSLDPHILKYEEAPTHKQDTAKKLNQFYKMAKASKRVYKLMMDNGNVFYIPNRYCSRGRMFMQGYHVTLQGTKYKRALINLNKKELIGGV